MRGPAEPWGRYGGTLQVASEQWSQEPRSSGDELLECVWPGAHWQSWGLTQGTHFSMHFLLGTEVLRVNCSR